MSNVKKYNVGQIKLDLPTPNYYHELPLLSFGDIHGSVNLSLVFNYRMKGSNPYHIANGCKLNLQKRIRMTSAGVLTSFENEIGGSVSLNESIDYDANSNHSNYRVYTFADESQRTIRKVNDTYELENFDFSKEIYDSTGKIKSVIDKYGVIVLSYAYDSQGNLTSVTYRNTKTIHFEYDSSYKLLTVRYSDKVISINHETNILNVIHYNGVTYQLSYLSNNFMATATATENASAITYLTKIEKPTHSPCSLKISNYVGVDMVDEKTYFFSDNIINSTTGIIESSKKYSQVDVLDKKGVRIRYEYQDRIPLYSYEVNANGEYENGDIHILGGVDESGNSKVIGSYSKNMGVDMNIVNPNSKTWEHNAIDYVDDRVNNRYIVTGWARVTGADSSSFNIHISKGNEHSYFVLKAPSNGNWKFFSCALECTANYIHVYTEDYHRVEFKDLKAIFNPTPNSQYMGMNDDSITIKDVLVYHGGNGYQYLPFDEVSFIVKDENLSNCGKVYFEDVLKYKLNRKKSLHTSEIYYNKCRESMYCNYGNAFKAQYDDSVYVIDNLYLGKLKYKKDGRGSITIYKDDGEAFLVCETWNSHGTVISSKTFNDKMDVICQMNYGVTITYTRENDLILTETTTDGGYVTYTKSRAYNVDENGDPTITDTDEFNKSTVYTLDSVWGNVKKITLPNGQVITDEFDSDGCAKLKRTFATGGRFNTYDYFGGNLSNVQGGDLSYDFIYSKGNLSKVKKNNTTIEEHETTDTQANSYYPDKTNAIHSNKATFDKYGRLASVDGVLTNTYRVDPIYYSGQFSSSEVDNIDSKLATSTDIITGNVTKLGYDDNNLTHIAEFNSSGSKLKSEAFTYDDINRVIQDDYVFGGKTIQENIEYETETDAVNADARIKEYEYNYNNIDTVSSKRKYDTFKRISEDTLTVGNNKVIKNYSYYNSMPSVVKHTKNNSQINNYNFEYDNVMRISRETDSSAGYSNSYVYDDYGQLERENNGHYGKTILYTYDENGNITKAQKYNYTTGDISGTPVEDMFSYSTTYPDRLISFNNKSITYNDNGCIKTYDGWTYTWNKGKLSCIEKNTSSSLNNTRAFISGTIRKYQYSYNAQGQRIKKEYTYFPGSIQQIDYMQKCTTTYEYDFKGRLLIDKRVSEYNDGATITRKFEFLYEGSDIVGVIYTNDDGAATYYYDKNPRGDVIAILDNSGNTVVKYTYDAYGNCNCYYSANNDLANSNPIRYRSYYYDEDTGLYYLNAIYYNPQWRRFIQPTNVSTLNPFGMNGLNQYTYANNNPIGIINSNSNLGKITTITTQNNLSNGFLLGSYAYEINLPDLSFLSAGFSFIDNAFSTISGAIDGYRKIKNLDSISGLEKASSVLMWVGIGLNVGLSAYENFLVNNSQPASQKWGNFVGDVAYIAVSSAITYGAGALVGMIPKAGPFLAVPASIFVGILLDQVWRGDNILWINGANISVKEKSLEEWLKYLLTDCFGG